MIQLTGLNEVSFILNDALIEMIESIPETKITLTTGKYLLVSESKEEIVRRIIDYRRQIFRKTIKRD